MSRYIDADAFLKSVKQKAYPQSGSVNESERKISLFGIMEILTAMPTADVVEVVHGEWKPNNLNGFKIYNCSNCGIHMEARWNFCPHCGARMDGGR